VSTALASVVALLGWISAQGALAQHLAPTLSCATSMYWLAAGALAVPIVEYLIASGVLFWSGTLDRVAATVALGLVLLAVLTPVPSFLAAQFAHHYDAPACGLESEESAS
jgi:hypothetical protein